MSLSRRSSRSPEQRRSLGLWSALFCLVFFVTGVRPAAGDVGPRAHTAEDTVRYDQALGPLAVVTSLFEAETEIEEEPAEVGAASLDPNQALCAPRLVLDSSVEHAARTCVRRARMSPRLTRGPPPSNLA